jgi:hypothetical protein
MLSQVVILTRSVMAEKESSRPANRSDSFPAPWIPAGANISAP